MVPAAGAAVLAPVSGIPTDARVMELVSSPSGGSAMVTTLLGGRVGMFAVTDSRAPQPLGTRPAADAARGLTGTRAFVSTDGLLGGWSLPGRQGFVVTTIDGGTVRRLRPPGTGGPATLWLAPGGNAVVARRGAGAGVWRAGATARHLTRVSRPGRRPGRVVYAASPSGDGFGSCADAGGRAGLARIRARSRTITDVTAPAGLRMRRFGRCAASDSGRAMATLVAGADGRGRLFATLRDEPRTIRLAGLRAGTRAHIAFVPRTTTLVIDGGDARCRGRRIWIVDVAASTARRLTTPSGMCGPAAVSADGRTIAVPRRGGLHIVRASDGRVRSPRLPAGPAGRSYTRATDVRVSADGARVTYLALTAGRGADLWSVGEGGGAPVDLTPPGQWIDSTRTFLVQSLDGSHAWTNSVGPRRDPLLTVPVAGFARTPFTPPPESP